MGDVRRLRAAVEAGMTAQLRLDVGLTRCMADEFGKTDGRERMAEYLGGQRSTDSLVSELVAALEQLAAHDDAPMTPLRGPRTPRHPDMSNVIPLRSRTVITPVQFRAPFDVDTGWE